MIQTADTDVVVITILNFHEIAVEEIWIAFGMGRHFRYIAVHEIAAQTGPTKSKALLMFHALTGCDVV